MMENTFACFITKIGGRCVATDQMSTMTWARQFVFTWDMRSSGECPALHGDDEKSSSANVYRLTAPIDKYV